MGKFRGLAALVALVMAVGCGEAPAALDEAPVGEVDQEIVNGQTTTGDPAVVYLSMGCSGTLVSPKVVLTACHCFQGGGGNPQVFFGSNINGNGTWINSVHSQVFPGNCIGDGDLAMVTLAQPGPTTPIPVNDRNLQPYIGDTVRIVGFGVTSEYGNNSGQKRVGSSPLSQVNGGEMFCNPTVQSGTCYGDSGGPNFMTFDGKEYVVGATSYGTQACGSGLDASARTDTHHQWIMSYIEQHDPPSCGADGGCATGCPAPDPDCPCADDGYCTNACGDASLDPDCEGCGHDGYCDPTCGGADSDCCIADGQCVAECGLSDPDCEDDGNGNGNGNGNGTGNGTGTGNGSGSGTGQGPATGDASFEDSSEEGAGGLHGTVCSLSSTTPRDANPVELAAWLLALAGLNRRVRGERRRRPRPE